MLNSNVIKPKMIGGKDNLPERKSSFFSSPLMLKLEEIEKCWPHVLEESEDVNVALIIKTIETAFNQYKTIFNESTYTANYFNKKLHHVFLQKNILNLISSLKNKDAITECLPSLIDFQKITRIECLKLLAEIRNPNKELEFKNTFGASTDAGDSIKVKLFKETYILKETIEILISSCKKQANSPAQEILENGALQMKIK